MSLVEQSLPARDADHSKQTQPSGDIYTGSKAVPNDSKDRVYPAAHETYDDAIFDEFYDMDDNSDVVAPSPKKDQASSEPPTLPQKSALRASRLLDNLVLKLGGSIESSELTATTPHDVYLSSEEEASSSADDFSDYDWDSDSEDSSLSPERRRSHEDTARVVSVVFSGKPSIIELSPSKRPISASSSESEARRHSTAPSTVSTTTIEPAERPDTPSSSVSSIYHPPRKSSMLSNLLTKQRPPFLNIDPYANGSTYSLEIPKSTPQQQEDESNTPKTPKTPTAILKGMTRTFSLVKKRSRPRLNTKASRDDLRRESLILSSAQEAEDPIEEASEPLSPEPRPQTPVTYQEIIRGARRIATPTSPSAHELPMSPTKQGRRGIMTGLAARRRSFKFNGKVV